MKDIVIIATTEGREEWLNQCVTSLKNTPYMVVSENKNYMYEIGKIRWMYENTNFDRWFFLQDSVVIKDLSLFDIAFSYPKSVSLCDSPGQYGMYLGVYSRETLEKIEIPKISTKREAVLLERSWNEKYCQAEGGVPTLFTDLSDANSKIIEIFGRKNRLLENNYLKKYKGTWHMGMIKD
ncbi:MAG: hypothetical protein ACO39G_07860 [Flavobacteriaceae bacterium]